MANLHHTAPRRRWLWLNGGAVLAATVFIVLILVGALPHIRW